MIEKLEIGKYYKLNIDNYYYSIDLKRLVMFNNDLIVKVKHMFVENRYFGTLVDISKITNTYYFASFFDIYNHMNHWNINIKPIRAEILENKYTTYINNLYKEKNTCLI